LIGRVLAERYEIVGHLSRGGAGDVYDGLHTTLKKPVAVKVLRAEFRDHPEAVARFLREAVISGNLRHENIVEILDFGRLADGTPFTVMERLKGEDLAALLRREGNLPWPRAKRICLQVCHALQAAHAAGIVHRDIKPENVFVVAHPSREDYVKVLDFGIAKTATTDHDLRVDGLETYQGAVLGTACYIAPEQARGVQIDARADIYALGAMLYELMTGAVAFAGQSAMEVLAKHICCEPIAPSDMAPHIDISPELDTLILKAMAREPDDRFQTIEELIDACTSLDEFGRRSGRGWKLPTRFAPAIAAGSLFSVLVTSLVVAAWAGSDDVALTSSAPLWGAAPPETMLTPATAGPSRSSDASRVDQQVEADQATRARKSTPVLMRLESEKAASHDPPEWSSSVRPGSAATGLPEPASPPPSQIAAPEDLASPSANPSPTARPSTPKRRVGKRRELPRTRATPQPLPSVLESTAGEPSPADPSHSKPKSSRASETLSVEANPYR
jgi:serine/threonine protein kinase